MATTITTVDEMELTGQLCLDYVNTGSRLLTRHADPVLAESSGHGPFGDRLERYDDLLRWSTRTGVLDAREAEALRSVAAADAMEAEAVLARAVELREALYRILERDTQGEAAAADDVERLATSWQEASGRRRLERTAAGYELSWPAAAELGRVIWPVVVSAVELLLTADRERVKLCASEDCNWLFWDGSKNRSRRWCEMSSCGNRAKARRYRARHH